MRWMKRMTHTPTKSIPFSEFFILTAEIRNRLKIIITSATQLTNKNLAGFI